MERINKIRQHREANFIQQRRVKAIKFEREKDKKEVDRDIRLIKRVELEPRENRKKKARVVVMKDPDGEENFDEEMNSDNQFEDDSESEMQHSSEDEAELN